MTEPLPQPDLSLRPREYLLVPLAAAVSAMFMFGLPPVGMPMVAAVLGRLIYSGSVGLAATTVGLSVVVTAAYNMWLLGGQEGPVSASMPAVAGMPPALMVLGVCLVLWWAAGAVRRMAAGRVFAVVTGVSFLSYLAAWASAAAAGGATLTEAVSAEVDAAMAQIGPMLEPGLSGPVAEQVQYLIRTMVIQSWPGTSLVLVMLGAVWSTIFLARLAAAHGYVVTTARPVPYFDAPAWVSLPVLAGAGTVMFMLLRGTQDTVAGGVALNVAIVFGAVVVAQGFAVSEAFMRRVRLGVVARTLIYGLLLWLTGLVPVLFVLGLTDMWLNLRRLPRGGPGPGGGAAVRDEADKDVGLDDASMGEEGPGGPGLE